MEANIVENITTISDQMEEALRNGQGNIFCQLADERLKKIKLLLANSVNSEAGASAFIKGLIHRQHGWLEFAENWLIKQKQKIEKLKQQRTDVKRISEAYSFKNNLNGKYLIRRG